MARYRVEGLAGLQNRSSRPHRCPHRLDSQWVEQGERLRREFRMTIRRIAHGLRPVFSTVAALLKRLRLNRLKLLEPKEPIRRFEKQYPGEMIHLDIKSLGRIRGVGHRITGDRRIRARGGGWEYVHACIDDHSRLAYVEVSPDERARSACAFLKRAVTGFAGQGVQVKGVMTDNGACYLSKAFAARRGLPRLRHQRTGPYPPKTNGKAERFIQTLLREWAYARAYLTSAQRRNHLPRWLNHYNRRRPHGGIGFQPPISRLSREQPA